MNYQYDKNGNPISKNNVKYSYDALDRLVQVKSDKECVQFTYDAFHRRLSKTVLAKDLSQKWYEKKTAIEWIDIEIGNWYGGQLGSMFTGFVWYWTEFDAPADWAGKKLILAFGAVDEQAWIWLNGKKAGENAMGTQAWNSPFEVDITDQVKAGEKNIVVVKVHNSAGPGGIWKPVKIFTDKD